MNGARGLLGWAGKEFRDRGPWGWWGLAGRGLQLGTGPGSLGVQQPFSLGVRGTEETCWRSGRRHAVQPDQFFPL